jgi:hypothetical protein
VSIEKGEHMAFIKAALLLSVLSAATAQAADSYFVNQRKEASMLLTGMVTIDPSGSVVGYTLDHPEKLPQPVKDIVKQNVDRWKFQFVSASATPASEHMSLRLVARMIDDQHASMRVAGISFDDAQSDASETIGYKTRPVVEYPKEAIEARAWGAVYLLVRVGPDGSVLDASAEQVNLGAFAPSADMARYRKYLADAAIKGTKKALFTVPAKGKLAGQPYWLVRIPVSFLPVGQRNADDFGTWSVYVPGPRMDVPWLEHPQLAAGAPDTVPDGSLHVLDGQPSLSNDGGGS